MKEIVYAEHNPYGDDDIRRSIIEVSWNREPAGHVQVATLGVEGTTLAPLPCVSDNGEPHAGGIYLTLNRDGCNKLIRNLRRAREQAFGRDA